MAGTSDNLELLHAATDRATIVRVPERRMLALDGLGSPSGGAFREGVDTLLAVADLVRAQLHRARRIETRIAHIECAWWSHPEPPPDEVPERFADRRTWHWQLMIEVPGLAREREIGEALAEARRAMTPGVEFVRTIRFAEGLSAQILHVGGPASEPDAVRRLYEEVSGRDLRAHGHLHEIHLSDLRRVPEGRRRTILRLPIVAGPDDLTG